MIAERRSGWKKHPKVRASRLLESGILKTARTSYLSTRGPQVTRVHRTRITSSTLHWFSSPHAVRREASWSGAVRGAPDPLGDRPVWPEEVVCSRAGQPGEGEEVGTPALPGEKTEVLGGNFQRFQRFQGLQGLHPPHWRTFSTSSAVWKTNTS